ncbi:ABC transporter permease [Anaeromicropila herbilytica]|uniref:Diguanylate cyclase n=1 Tax=Anaeromicropila herbilytica TaxID=2785025 RepID=A0A7R7EP21_9FIRM|nr:ABC transporter permease [Anaeromicropila herbilytica]BCN32430.1 diguanylate cyclase [Anaeromicropila herbilytica]
MKTKNINFIIGSILVGIMLVFVLIGIFYTPYNPNQMDGSVKNMAPSFTHFFGTDNFGRDIFSRCMEGAKTTFLVAIITVSIGVIFGTVIGAISGYYGGILDEIFMRIIDVLLAFPSILLALVFVSVLGTGTFNIIVALGILFIPSFARVVRSEVIAIKQLDYVKNAKLMGASSLRIMFVHILPSTFPILLSAITIGFNNAILAEAGMSYLGLGVQPPEASLGRMLSEAQTYIFSAPWYAIAPGIIIVVTVLGFSLMNEG